MALIHTAIGAVAVAAGGVAIWAMFFVLEAMGNSFDPKVGTYLLAAPLVLIVSYFLGGAIYANRK